MKKYLVLIMAVIVSVGAFIGCTKNEEMVEENKEEVIQTHRVVATSVAVVEILDALGVEVIGVPTSSYDLPESVVNATKVGNPMSPDMEIIKSLSPTIVVGTDTLGNDYMDLFNSNNIEATFLNLDSLDGLKEGILNLAQKFNKESKGEELLKSIEEKEKALKEKALLKEEKKILIAFAAPGGVAMLATEESYIGNLVSIVGGKNITDDTSAPFISYNKEALSQLNPDMVLVMTHALPEQTKAEFSEMIKTDAGWKNIEAVKNGKVIYLDSSKFGMSANLKIMDALEELSGIIYEE